MKKTMVLALVSVAAIGVQAGEIALNSTWTEFDSSATDISGQSASGFTMVTTSAGSTQKTVYQGENNGDFTALAFNVGDTATLSFTATIDSSYSLNSFADGLRFSMYDEASGDGVTGQLDYGTQASRFARVGGYRAFTGYDRMGSLNFSTDLTTSSSNPLDAQGASSDISLSVTRDALNTYTTILDYGGTFVTNITTDANMNVNEIGAVGIRLNGQADNKFAVSNLTVEVIPEPATLGLVALVGGALLFARRIFTV